jgi:hypothetical protein
MADGGTMLLFYEEFILLKKLKEGKKKIKEEFLQ